MKKYVDIDEIVNEEILIHPTCNRDHKGLHDIWTGEARIIGEVIIKNKKYAFNKVINVEFEPVIEEK